MKIDDFIVDQNEIETFKQVTRLTIDKRVKGYTCFCKAFCLFVSEKEIYVDKSPVIKAFNQISSVKEFIDMGLPIKRASLPDAAI